MKYAVSIEPGHTAKILSSLVAVFALLSLATIALRFGFGHVSGFVHQFYLGNEYTLPNFFASLLLLGASALLAIIASRKYEIGGKFRRHWLALAIIFFCISASEILRLHENLNRPMREVFGAEGFFYFGWVIPGLALVLLLALAYFRFLLHLKKRYRLLFLASAATYVGGALGLEMVSAHYAEMHGRDSPAYALLATDGETMELLGVTLFIYALLEYIEGHLREVRFRLGRRVAKARERAAPLKIALGGRASAGGEEDALSEEGRKREAPPAAVPSAPLERSASSAPSEGGGESIALVLGADESFALPMAVTLYSALANLSPESKARVFILDGGLSKESRARLERVARKSGARARIEWREVEAERLAREVNLHERFSPAVLLRLVIPEVLPERFERAIYLDSDLVVEEDLTRLWQTDFEGKALLAARERWVSHSENGIQRWRELDLSPEAPYFNSGVLVMNLRRWREERIAEEVLSYLRCYREALNHLSDQEGLNAVLAKRWKALDPRWNALYQFYELEEGEELGLGREWGYTCEEVAEEAFVIHYSSGRHKPWRPECRHPETGRFHGYLRKSGWFTLEEYLRWKTEFVLGRVKVLWGVAKDVTRPYRHAAKRRLRQGLDAVRD